MIEFPPQISQEEYLKVLLTDPLEKLKAIIEKNNDKYSYWSDVKYQKAPEGISSKELWCYIKASQYSAGWSARRRSGRTGPHNAF